MMKKRMLGVLALMLVCIFALSGCKKNVGTPEDNAVKEDSQDGEDAEEEEDADEPENFEETMDAASESEE